MSVSRLFAICFSQNSSMGSPPRKLLPGREFPCGTQRGAHAVPGSSVPCPQKGAPSMTQGDVLFRNKHKISQKMDLQVLFLETLSYFLPAACRGSQSSAGWDLPALPFLSSISPPPCSSLVPFSSNTPITTGLHLFLFSFCVISPSSLQFWRQFNSLYKLHSYLFHCYC